MKQTFIKTSDPDMAAKLKALGFIVVSEQGGITTFLNDVSITQTFANDPVVYSDKLEM